MPLLGLVALAWCLGSLLTPDVTSGERGDLAFSWQVLPSAFLSLGARVCLTDILVHPIRKRVYAMICDRPGIGYRQLQRAVPLANGTLEFHLARLERAGLVTLVSQGGRTCYCPAGRRAPATDVPPSERQQRILEYLDRSPGASTLEVQDALRIAQSTASYHLGTLRALGFVTAERVGHSLHWRRTDASELSNIVPQHA